MNSGMILIVSLVLLILILNRTKIEFNISKMTKEDYEDKD